MVGTGPGPGLSGLGHRVSVRNVDSCQCFGMEFDGLQTEAPVSSCVDAQRQS
jgi:hypothetical protein